MASNYCTAPAVKAAIITAIQAVEPELQVAYGPVETAEGSYIAMGDVIGSFEVPSNRSARKHRQETYTVTVLISVVQAYGTVEDTETEAFRLMGVLEDLCANNPAFPGVNQALLGDFECGSGHIPNAGSVTDLVITIQVSNRLN